VEYQSEKRHTRTWIVLARGLREEHDHGAAQMMGDIGGIGARTDRCRRRGSTIACAAGWVPYIVVYLNKADMVDDAELLSWWSLKVLIYCRVQVSRGKTPIIRDLPEGARGWGNWGALGLKLVQALDDYHPVPKRAVEGHF